jgi:hypothetical protein
MLMLAIIYASTLAAGLLVAQLARAGYAAFAGEALAFHHLVTPGFFQPVRALAVIAAAPALLLSYAWGGLAARPLLGVIAAASSLLWSFCMGVVIMTRCFGLT